MRLKKIIFLLLGIIMCLYPLALNPVSAYAEVSVSADCVKVLLIGNSYTYYNGYGEILSKLGALSGKSLLVVRATKGDTSGTDLLKKNLEYKAWYNGEAVANGSGKTLAEISAIDFGGINRGDQWNAVFLQNNASNGALESSNAAIFNAFVGKIPNPRAFVINDAYISTSVSDKRGQIQSSSAAQCGCSVMNTRSIFEHYTDVFETLSWMDDLTYLDGSCHPTPRAAYLFALCTYAKLYGTDKLSSYVGDYANFIPLYNSVGGTTSEFVADKFKTKDTSEEAMTVTMADASGLQYLVRSHFIDCIGETVLTTVIIVPAYPGYNGSINTINTYTGELTAVPIPAPQTAVLSATAYTYSGKEKTPSVTVYDNTGNIISADKYTVTYESNIKIGTAKAVVTFRGKYYTGSLTACFKINPKKTKIKKLTKIKNGFTVKYKKPKGDFTGYQIQYAENKKFAGAKKTTVKNINTVTKTVTKLKAKKKYYVRVRTYKKINGKNYYSEWSAISKIKTN